jgi:hypothetical protein
MENAIHPKSIADGRLASDVSTMFVWLAVGQLESVLFMFQTPLLWF